MFRPLALAIVGLTTIVLAGCRDRYKEVADLQVANWKEIASILRDVKDRPSMDDAEEKLLARVARFQEVTRLAKSLPPPDEAVSQRLAAERAPMQSALRDMLKEVARVKTLPGGPEFFERVKELFPSVPQGSTR